MKTVPGKEAGIRRRRLLQVLAWTGIGAPMGVNLIAQSKTKISAPLLRDAAVVLGENFGEERFPVIEVALQRNLDQFQSVRDFEVDDLIEPAPVFVTKRYAASAGEDHAPTVEGVSDRRNGGHHG
jgi:hypothetical protein